MQIVNRNSTNEKTIETLLPDAFVGRKVGQDSVVVARLSIDVYIHDAEFRLNDSARIRNLIEERLCCEAIMKLKGSPGDKTQS